MGRLESRGARALITAWACALALAAASPVEAQRRARSAVSPWDGEVQRLHDEVVRRGSRPDAIVPLIELGSTWSLSPARTLTLLHALGENRRVLPLLRFYARTYEVALLRRSGRRDEAARLAETLAFVRRWRVVGPFDNEGKHGFDAALPPETALDRETALDVELEGFGRSVRWETLPELGAGESVPLAPFFTPSTDVCAYAETFVELDRARPVALLGGASGAMRVWWNGARALEDTVYREVDADRVASMVEGRAGWNRVLVKVCSADGGLGFMLRVAEADGTPLRVQADPDGARASSPASASRGAIPPPPVTILAGLEAAVVANAEDADAHEALARYLQYSNGADPTTNRVRDLATRAAELRPTVRNLLFASRMQGSRAETLRLVQQAVALAPTDPEAALSHAALVWEGAGGERALRMLEAIPQGSVFALSAMVTRAHVLGELGLPRSAHALYEELVRRVPASPYYLRLLAESEERRGHVTRSSELRRQLLAVHTDDVGTRRILVEQALARGDREMVMAMVSDELALHPVSSETMGWAAATYDALADETAAVDALRRAADLDRGDAVARVELGRLLLRLGRRDAALGALREALALRPQDASTRRLLEQVEPEARPDEAYATDIQTILARRRPDGEYPATLLHHLEVQSVHESGLGSRFHQVVTQIHDQEGARAYRSYAFSYEPGSQFVEVQSARVYRGGEVLTSYQTGERSLAQPAYRIYYSARQVVVTFPVLQPGDVIEVRYRIEDVAARNAFADYFGAMRPLQMAIPIAHLEHVFHTPSARRFYFHAPEPLLTHTERVDGGTRIHRFTASDVPAMRSEPRMPGYAEVAPYLHVSTFETWEQVARFWWGLVDDQIQPDAALERTVRELVDGAPDTRTKVQRIYAWATDHVRYVGLELGIHGHQPYRVTDVVERGFGDCKDTAALLYVMLRLAGIDARIALVRTRPNGDIDRSPASLAVFDHAIAYVPELDLFLDGTAEHGGIDELPSMDEGALALVVGPSTAELRTLPMGVADASGRRRELTIELTPDGGATLRASEELRGQDAMGARGTFDSPGTRRERLTGALAGTFPGIQLESETFEPLDQRERPVRYTWSGRVPRVGERDGGTIRIAPSTVGALTQSWASLPSRRHPLVLGPPFHYRERRVIVLGGLRAEDVPPGGVAESPFGRVSVRYTDSAREVVVETELVLSRERVTAEEYAAFRAWVERADALLRARVAIGGVR